jgi:hypothetical protein
MGKIIGYAVEISLERGFKHNDSEAVTAAMSTLCARQVLTSGLGKVRYWPIDDPLDCSAGPRGVTW